MPLPPLVALEIGTSKVTALVAELGEDGHVMIIGMGEHPTTGVRKGEITDLENATTCVKSALEAAEESGKVAIRQVHLAVSGGHIRSAVNRGAVPVLDRHRQIGAEDMEQVMDLARAVNLSADREILHTICQHFYVDGQQGVVNPEGMEGARLALDMLVVHGIRTQLHNTIRAVRSIPLDVEDVVFSGICSGLAVLTEEQRKAGAIVIDLGGGTTDFVAYSDGVPAVAGVLAVGGDHVTNDITLAFNIPMTQAERLKKDAGAACVSAGSGRLSLPAEGGFPGRTVSVRALQTVINARLDEVFQAIRRRLDTAGLLHHMGAGVVLTGGGAHMEGVQALAQQVFGLPSSIGRPRDVSGVATAAEGPEYATCSGLAHYGFRTAAERRRAMPFGGWLKGLFRK